MGASGVCTLPPSFLPPLPPLSSSPASFSLSRFSLFLCIYQGVRNKASFPPDVVEAYKYTFSKPGALTGPINYIRAVYNTPEMLFPAEKKMIEIPTLIVWVSLRNFSRQYCTLY